MGGEAVKAAPVRWWRELARPEFLILGLAVLLRVLWLDMKPPHFDEGVNGWFIDQMSEQGFYHYDPTNFHGPLHFYLLFLAQTLLGRAVWVLRLPVVLFGVGAVVLALGYARFLGRRTCLVAALALAISPAMTFYTRYAIHETELLFFLMLAGWGLLGVAHFAEKKYLWAAALGLTGCILTKETYAIHFIAFALAVPALLLLEAITRPGAESFAPQRWTDREVLPVAGVSFGLILFFYTGGFMDWSSLPGLVTTFQAWVVTGVRGGEEGGHTKPMWYWLELLVRYEWPALIGLAASGWFIWHERSRALRWLILTGWAALFAYSVVRYKTPWCIICFAWPFLFVFGRLVDEAFARWGRWGHWATIAVAVVALGHSGWRTLRLNFRDYTDEEEPYVYVQTLPAIQKITGPLWRHVAENPANRHLPGFILFPAGGAHPLPWVLGDFPGIEMLDERHAPPSVDADFLLVDDPFVSDVEDRLKERYFRETIVLRGNSGQSAELYFRASTFAYQFPGREPEFTPLGASDASLEERIRALERYLESTPK